MSGSKKIEDGGTEIDADPALRAHDGFRPVDIFTFRHREKDSGDWEHAVRREIVRSPRIVAVLPYDPAARRLVLIRQFRLGAHLATGKGMMIEIVAGAVDEGETAEIAARRELTEETGLAALSLDRIVEFLPSPGTSDECVDLYLARVDAGKLPDRAGHDDHEIIYPFLATPAEAIAAADSGAVGNAFTLLALNWFDRHKERLFAER
ncbi:MAG TPA: NUDIX hydrolase [Pararhizobium sp.]|nr:NUDIX hydrolase [Pararhizobium sp.]